MADKPKQFVRCREGFVIPGGKEGRRVQVVKGGEVREASDPIVKKHKDKFETIEEVVEQASAAPGERRTLRRETVVKVGDK